ncbi:branched-chain amino acid ABC transporter permease [Bosea sp. (in: a-proteobacteria)]|uniref:branched-chain amino acid ABC transporter permease n=1 Tax=Bosea sp. (in: a-proteobacteria) TaxID=1871050 RepID=UPI00260A46E1|nr:branched-chain amino acid ABC transporter permease [Bosea sp. (in: a-proteobacteria)]MCO5092931.1 branched-chain amino acid ABC transporter permease [Bosea sp. (in: a-proteobacteria)]
MTALASVPLELILGQLVLGMINGAFYALLSLGLAVIFGMMNIINFAHGAFFMLGAFVAWLIGFPNTWLPMISPGLSVPPWLAVNFWGALIVAPLIVAAFALLLERIVIKRIYGLDPHLGLLLTFGMALVIEGIMRNAFGSTGNPYPVPPQLRGGFDAGILFIPYYRLFAVVAAFVICLGTWLVIEKTPIGARLRAATENPKLVLSFGVNVPRMIALTYAGGIMLAAAAGVLAAPIYSVNPSMGTNLVVIVFAVVVIGGMGSIMGSIATGFGLGIVEGLTKVFYPAASSTVIFIIMVVVLTTRPNGLFGKAR